MGQINILKLNITEHGSKTVINKIGKLFLEVVEEGSSEHWKNIVVNMVLKSDFIFLVFLTQKMYSILQK